MARLARWFADCSIRTKVTAVVVGVSVTAVVVMGLAVGFMGYERTRSAMVREVQALARVSAGNLRAPVVFGDRQTARETLKALQHEPKVKAARVIMPDGRLLAQVPSDRHPRWQTPASGSRVRFLDDSLEVVHPIERDGTRVASLQLKISLARLAESQQTLLLAGLGVVAGAIALAVILARPLCRYLIAPVEDLATAVERVRSTRDFSVRVPARGRDEVGALVNGFNDMLGQIRAYSEHMEELVQQRTRDLAQSNEELRRTVDELESAKHEAEASNAAKTRFLANMSHELRTPLNAILGFSEILNNQAFGQLGNAKYVEYAGDIHDSAAHLLNIINDVLDVARLESGRFSLTEDKTSLMELSQEVDRMLSVTAEDGGINLHARIDQGDDVTLLCDPARMRQVLLNLVANALKFTPRGGTVSVNTAPGEDGGLVISVTDTGCGMDPADVPRILEPFGQVASPYARNHQGTGLGLALCKQIVEMHGGTLDVATAPDAGTTVHVILPANRVAAAPAAETASGAG